MAFELATAYSKKVKSRKVFVRFPDGLREMTGEEGRKQSRKKRKGDQLERARAVGGGGHSIPSTITVLPSDIL